MFRISCLKNENAINIISFGFNSNFSEHERNLPQLLHINFHVGYYRLITAICTNTLFSTFTSILKTLTIFFQAFYTMASAWGKFNRFSLS